MDSKIFDVSREEFRAMLIKLGADRPCEACGNESMAMPASLRPNGGLMSLSMSVDGVAGEVVHFTPLMCLRCGNTRFVNVDTLVSGFEHDAGQSD